MDKQYYAMHLMDPATPAYCSADKLYIGTKEELDIAIQSMSKDESYADAVSAYRKFWQGNADVMHRVACRGVPILTPVYHICASRFELGRTGWEHINVWGCPYRMRMDGASVKQLLIKGEQKYYRMLRVWVRNLRYEGAVGKWYRLERPFWGHGGLLDVQRLANGNTVLNNLLYVEQDRFEDAAEAGAAMLDPKRVIMDRLCDEIFADG